jgi:transcriptional regulator with GAF, ATPase, and Fis domain
VNSNLDIKQADAFRNAHELLEQHVLQRTAELVQANDLLRQEIEERKRVEEALRNSYLEIENLKNRLQAETDYLKAEAKVTQACGGIVDESNAMQQVLRSVEQVAPTDSSVLLLGETGTGKELIAQSIHDLSPRKNHVMVKVNCAALPQALVESELFGRERGAYTGALTRQAGRFELADGSTLFLDDASRPPGRPVRAPWQPQALQSRRPPHRRHQPRSHRRNPQRSLPRRPLLPP